MSSAHQSTTRQRDVDAMEIFALFGIIFPMYQKMHPHSLDPKADPFHRFELDADDGEYDSDDEDKDERPEVQPEKKVGPKSSLTLLDLHPHVLLVFSLMNVRTDKITSAVALSKSTVEFQFGSAVVKLKTMY